ncbi:MAG: S8 family serine peptidase [FCB group bacterium]|nr:S8 family serine peptidase [FCB group bacterium]
MRTLTTALILIIFAGIGVSAPAAANGKYSDGLIQLLDRTTPEMPVKVWVYFTDKGYDTSGELRQALRTARETIPERTLRRRSKTRHGNLIDERDLPCSASYIRQVLETGAVRRISSKWLNALSVSATTGQLEQIGALPFVQMLEPVYGGIRREPTISGNSAPAAPAPLMQTRNDYGPSLYQLQEMNVIAAHEAGYTGEGVLVLMLDTGFYKDHQTLHADQIVAEWDFINDDGNTQNEEGDPENQHSHGTATLSTLGGSFDGQLYGPAYNANFLLAKTEDISQEQPIEEDWYVAGLEWGEGLGADVASSSLGYIDWYTQDDLDGETAVTTLAVNIAIENGMVIATAAGNSGQSGIIAPADAFKVITCGAVDSSGVIAGFSSRGPTADGRIKPEVCARGVQTYCAAVDGPDTYRHASGTSLSTPLIGGACAVILSAHPDWTPRQVRAALMLSADNAETPDNNYGWGIIDVMAAINLSLIYGDVDGNGLVNIVDIVLAVNYLIGSQTPDAYQAYQSDVNEDGVLDITDIVLMVNIVLGLNG